MIKLILAPFWIFYKIIYGIRLKIRLHPMRPMITKKISEMHCSASIDWGMGLATKRGFFVAIIFITTEDMDRFEKAVSIKAINDLALNEIGKCGLDINDFNKQPVSYHSHDIIMQQGGYYAYFK